MIKYKFSVLSELKKAGFTTTTIRKQNILSEKTLTSLRHGGAVSFASLNIICTLLHCQPGDLLEYVPDDPATNTDQ